MSDAIEASVRAGIREIAETVEGDDFWIDGRPYTVLFGEEYPGELDEIAKTGLTEVLGWRPLGILGFDAGCNSQEDHQQLATLCILFGRKLDGIIDFGGKIALGPSLDGRVAAEPVRIEDPAGLQGVLFATSYETHDGSYATCHYGDMTLMESWMKDSRFRMVK